MASTTEHTGQLLRNDALAAAYRSADDRMVGVTERQFMDALEDWEVYPLSALGKVCGALLIKGPEIHACVEPWAHKRWVTKAALKKFKDVTDKHGYSLTRVAIDRSPGHDFVRRLGFEKVAMDGFTIIYMRRSYGN